MIVPSHQLITHKMIVYDIFLSSDTLKIYTLESLSERLIAVQNVAL